MTSVNLLMAKALNSLDDYVLSKSLCGTAFAIVEFCNKIKKSSFNYYLKNFDCGSEKINGWALPDAVWSRICLKYPELNFYPLGVIAERAAKKTIIKLSFPTKGKSNMNIGEQELLKNLRNSIKSLQTKGILELFLTEYFFEMCIDQSRRSWKELEFDLEFRYNFSEKGHFIPLSVEKELRTTLENQCKEKAKKFVLFLEKCTMKNNFAKNKQIIIHGFDKVFGATLPKRGDFKKFRKPFVNVVVGDISLSKLKKSYTIDKNVKRFFLHTKNSNVSISFDVLNDWLGHEIHSLVKDLLDIGVVVYMADLYTERKSNLERNLNIIMPVRHPFVWSNAQKEIEKTVSFLGRDNFSIKFVKRKEKADKIGKFNVKSGNKCVCLFSGGLDTFSGAVWALENKLDPVFVSHYSSGLLSGKQKLLINKLGKVYGKPLEHLDMRVSKASGKKVKNHLPAPFNSVMIQHLRSFLFLCLASAVALESKIKKIYILENGPVTLNPLFSEARVNTRTTHPHFLAGFGKLIKSVFEVDLVIESPFLYLTKGEVVKNLAKPKLDGLAAKTISCWNWSRVPLRAMQKGFKKFNGRHDGVCIPCIIRRASMNRAHLFDKDARYLTNVFTQFSKLERNDKTMVADFVRFCKNMNYLPDSELLFRFPDLSLYEKGIDSKEIIDMYKRHSKEVVDCFRSRSNKKFKKLFAPTFGE